MRRARRVSTLALLLAASGGGVPTATRAGAQTLEILTLPAWGTLGQLSGEVGGVDPAAHHVAVFIQIEGAGWWSKPTLAGPTVPIAPDGSFSADVGTGGPGSLDSRATLFCAALLPIAETPDTVAGGTRMPETLAPLASDCQEHFARTLSFAGRSWAVKEAPLPVGPGANRFSDRSQDVFVDEDGLHLRLDFHDGAWWGAEVLLLDQEGHGTWLVQTDSRLDLLDQNVTFGIFTWDPFGDDDAVPGSGNREIDFEDSRWGDAGDPTDAQYVVQPWTVAGNLTRYALPDLSADPALTRFFAWVPGGIQFGVLAGHHLPCCFPAGALVAHGLYLEDPAAQHFVPSPGRERLRLNLWLNAGGAPSDGQPVEVLVRDVVFLPEPGAGLALPVGALALAALARRRQSPTRGDVSP